MILSAIMTAEEFKIDYHRLLGVNKNADNETICRAFRQLSRQYHPDKVSGQEEMMKLLTKAKITLLDPEKRVTYEANYEPSDAENDLIADLLKLNIGFRLSDTFKCDIEQWKQQYHRIQITVNVDTLEKLTEKLQKTMFDKRTVFDFGMDQLINHHKSEESMLEELKAIFIAQDFANLAKYILTHQRRSVLTNLYNDVKPTHGYEMPNRFNALLQIIKASSTIVLADENYPQQNRIKGLYEAVLIFPTDECINCVVRLINNRLTAVHKQEVMDAIVAENILNENVPNKQYMQKLKNTATFKSITRYEKGINREV